MYVCVSLFLWLTILFPPPLLRPLFCSALVEGVAIHRNGVVQGEDGLFVSGWLKRGPSGVIGTNRDDAEETVSHFVASRQDREDSSRWISKKGGVEEFFSLLAEKVLFRSRKCSFFFVVCR